MHGFNSNSISYSSSSSSAATGPGEESTSTPTLENLTGTRIVSTRRYVDHVYTFPGQAYDVSTESTLMTLKELSSSDRLCLKSRQLASRDVHILLPYKSAKFETHKYDTFLYNFNKLALACYLKVSSKRFDYLNCIKNEIASIFKAI